MKTEIMKTQKLNFKKLTLLFLVGIFTGQSLYHFIKTMTNLF
jgi:hypothetical protein